MSSAAELIPFATLGVLGALHCVGMCGGFALMVAGTGRPVALRILSHQGLYILGKATCYAVVGLALSLAMHATYPGADSAGGIALDPHAGGSGFAGLRTLQWGLSLAAGGLLIWIGLGRLGLSLPGVGGTHGAALPGRALLRRALAGVRALPGWAGALGTGVVNGLVPCGLSLGAWLLAIQVEPPVALVGCFLFGLTSAPALVALALGSTLTRATCSGRAQGVLSRVLGVVLVIFGSLALVRATRAEALDPADGEAPCCVPSGYPSST